MPSGPRDDALCRSGIKVESVCTTLFAKAMEGQEGGARVHSKSDRHARSGPPLLVPAGEDLAP